MGIDDLIIIVGISRNIVSPRRIDCDCRVARFLFLIIIQSWREFVPEENY